MEDLFLSDELPNFYSPDTGLDQRQQILDTIAFIRKPVPEEHKLTSDTAFTNAELNNLLLATYKSPNALLDVLFDQICEYKGTKHKKRYWSSLNGRNSRKKAKKICEDISSLIYNNETSNCFPEREELFFALPKKMQESIGPPSEIDPETNNTNQFIQDKQVWLFQDLMRRNQTHINLGRNLPYTLLARTEDFPLYSKDFFGEDDSTTDNACDARLYFSFLTAHIGYFNKPQFGKWESLYSCASNMEPDEILNEGIIFGTPHPPSQVESLIQQLYVQTVITKRIIIRYQSALDTQEHLEQDIERTEAQKEELTKAKAQLRKKYNTAKSELKESRRQLTELYKADEKKSKDLVEQIRESVEQEYEGLPQKLKDTQHSLEEYKQKAQYFEERATSYEKSLKQTRKELRRSKQTVSTQDKRIAQLEEENARYKEDEEKRTFAPRVTIDAWLTMKDDKVDKAVTSLYRAICDDHHIGTPLRKTDRDTAYQNLKQMYQNKFDSFFKLRGPYNTIIFYAIKEDHPVIVWAGSHRTYDKKLNEFARKGY